MQYYPLFCMCRITIFFLDTDLHAVIKGKILQPIHMQYITSQLCRVLKYIHSGNVIHRDLKPSNILINSECFIKVRNKIKLLLLLLKLL